MTKGQVKPYDFLITIPTLGDFAERRPAEVHEDRVAGDRLVRREHEAGPHQLPPQAGQDDGQDSQESEDLRIHRLEGSVQYIGRY